MPSIRLPLEREIALPTIAEAYERLSSRLEEIQREAPDGYARALAVHLRAQALFIAGRSTDAAKAFDAAQAAWMKIGDRERALAALVAEAEDLQRAGAYADVLGVTRSLGPTADSVHYFGVRLENSRCLALQYLGKLDDSATCYRWTQHALGQLGETLERISTQQDYGQLEADRGNLDHAARLGEQALTDIADKRWNAIAGPDIPIVRGRIERLLSDLAVQRGDVAEALRHSQRALVQFEKARHVRWQANTLLRIATIYNQVGAYADATDAVDIALQRLSARDAPARVAAATLTKAQIELARGRVQQASEQAASAEAIYDSLRMPVAVAAARLTIAEAKIAAGDFAAAHGEVDDLHDLAPSLASRVELVRAELSIDDLHMPLAGNRPRPLSEWLRAQIVVARRMDSGGRHDAALLHLEKAALYVSQLAARTRNPIVQKAVERTRRQLLSAALPLILACAKERQVALAWRWLLLIDTGSRGTVGESTAASAMDFDRALAESLLRARAVEGDRLSEDRVRMQQRLLDLVTASFGPRATLIEPSMSLEAFQRTLPAGTVFVALLCAGDLAADLIVSVDGAKLVPRRDIGAQQDRALLLVRDVTDYASVAAIDAEVRGVSEDLLAAGAGMPAPKRLLIYAPEPFNGLPWSMLHWPGASKPLVETSAVTLVSLDGRSAPGVHGVPRLEMFAAAADRAEDASELPALASVVGELAAVASERRRYGWTVNLSEAADRAAVLKALVTPGGWVHVASHGSSSAGYLGRSGIWLGGIQGAGAPDLLSWMDVVENGVGADVVVLNACALASTPQANLSAATSFADAVLRAGAGDVVAALWPVNDTAAYLWSSSFYAHLPMTPSSDDIAEALRQAMLRLRDTRAYRHPKYWASLVHLARMPLELLSVPPP